MKQMMCLMLLLIATGAWAVEANVKVCNFDELNKNHVYTVHTRPGIGTTFKLPDGWEIDDLVVMNTKYFYGESNGVIATVKALASNKDTSVVIYTTSGRLFVFLVTSRQQSKVDTLVVCEVNDQKMFKKIHHSKLKNSIVARPMKVAKNRPPLKSGEKLRLLFGTHSDYQVKRNYFQVKKVVDDGVFTYISMAQSQIRPSVFISRKNKVKTFEPVKYVDKGDYYMVYRVPLDGEKLFLKAGNKITEIKKD